MNSMKPVTAQRKNPNKSVMVDPIKQLAFFVQSLVSSFALGKEPISKTTSPMKNPNPKIQAAFKIDCSKMISNLHYTGAAGGYFSHLPNLPNRFSIKRTAGEARNLLDFCQYLGFS